MNLYKDILKGKHFNSSIIKFAILILISEFVRGAYMIFLPLYAYKKLFYSEVTVGMVFCTYFFIETVSKIGVGWILDRFNNKMTLICGLLLSLLSLYTLQFISSPLLLILNSASFGLGFAPVWLMVLGYITSFPEKKRAQSMAIIYSTWLIGLGTGAVIINFLITKSFPFALNAMIFIWSLSLIIAIFINEEIRNAVKVDKQKESAKLILKELLNAKYLVPGMVFQTLSLTILIPIIPKYFIDIGLSENLFGAIFAAIGGITVISMIIFGILTKIFGVIKSFIFGLLFTSVGIFGLGNIKAVIPAIIFGLITGISFSAVLPSWNAIMSNNISKDNKGLMWGIFSTLEGTGRALGPLIGGLLAQYISIQFSFNFSAVIILGLAVFYFLLNKFDVLKYSSQ